MPIMESEVMAEQHKRKEMSAHGFSLVFHTFKNSLQFDGVLRLIEIIPQVRSLLCSYPPAAV